MNGQTPDTHDVSFVFSSATNLFAVPLLILLSVKGTRKQPSGHFKDLDTHRNSFGIFHCQVLVKI